MTTAILPEDFSGNMVSKAIDTLSGIAPILYLIIGISLFVFIIQLIFRILENRKADLANVESEASAYIKKFKLSGGRAVNLRAMITGRRSKSARRAIELNENFRKVASGEGISTLTK